MNSLGGDQVTMVAQALKEMEKNFEGLVVDPNQGANSPQAPTSCSF